MKNDSEIIPRHSIGRRRHGGHRGLRCRVVSVLTLLKILSDD
jgi:hypothetical protein